MACPLPATSRSLLSSSVATQRTLRDRRGHYTLRMPDAAATDSTATVRTPAGPPARRWAMPGQRTLLLRRLPTVQEIFARARCLKMPLGSTSSVQLRWKTHGTLESLEIFRARALRGAQAIPRMHRPEGQRLLSYNWPRCCARQTSFNLFSKTLCREQRSEQNPINAITAKGPMSDPCCTVARSNRPSRPDASVKRCIMVASVIRIGICSMSL